MYRKHGFSTQSSPYYRLYVVWRGMMSRCYNSEDKGYYAYGAKGIRVCRRWHKVENFVADASSLYEAGLFLDRLDGSKSYSPENCRWADNSQSNRNRKAFGGSSFRGVYRLKDGKRGPREKKWHARIWDGGKRAHLGYFREEEEAARAYDKAVFELFGWQPYLNFPNEYSENERSYIRISEI